MKQTKTGKYCQSLTQRPGTIARGFSFALLGFFGCLSLSANAATVYTNNFYSNDFQDSIGSEWSHTSVASAPNPDYGGTRLFLGEFGNETVSLSLNGLSAHGFATVSFSLYLIRSWDGDDTTVVNDLLGPDIWSLGVAGGPTLLSTTFSSGNAAGQSYDGEFSLPGTQPSCSAYASWTGPAGSHAPLSGANECFSLGYTFSYPQGYVYPDGHTCTDPEGCPEAMDSVYNLSFTFAHNASDLVLNFSAAGLQGLADESWGLDNVQVAVAPVPVPPAVWLFGSGLLGLIGIARRKTRMS
ncbi:MAG: hypothetical protein ACYC1T_12050 [Sulfuricaulis sp.]